MGKYISILATVGFGAMLLQSTSAFAVTIAYSGFPSSQAFWAGVDVAVKQEAEKQGVTLLDLSPSEADAAAQRDAIQSAIDQGVDGLIIGPIDNLGLDEVLAKALEKKIPVVTIDTAVENPAVKSLVQTDNLKAAGLAGQYIADHAKKGTVLILGGTEGHQTGNARRDGVKTAVEAAGFKVIFQICDWKEDCAYEQTLTQTKANSDITAVFAAWDPGALAAVSAATEAGTIQDLVIVGFDGNPDNLESIKAGQQSASVKQDNTRMGTEGVRNVLALIKGETVAAFTPIDGILIDKANVAEFLK